jgi:hypothetical protein
MSECGQQAILLITVTPMGTSTHVARERVQLRCQLQEHHQGPHRDLENKEEWEAPAGRIPTLLRDENEPPP